MNIYSEKLQRLEELHKLRPQFGEIFDFYSGLCTFLQGEGASWLNCRPDLETWDQRRKVGFQLLNSTALKIDVEEANSFLSALIDSLIALGQEGEDELKVIRQAVASGKLATNNLLIACLERDRAPLIDTAKQLKVPSALLEYVCSTALAFGLQHWLKKTPLPLSDGWVEGYCPICGGTPAMGELVGEQGVKRLHCSICANGWEVSRLKCSYCGNEETDSLEYFTAEGETGYRVDVCRKCSCYLKVVDSREIGEGLPMDVEDLNTMHLDLLAQKEGFAKGKIDRKV